MNNGFGNNEGLVSVRKKGWFRRLMAFMGPAYIVSVGYMDPGNWATDIEGGARFGYSLIWVLLLSNIMAIGLQTLSARLGIVTGYDLAQGCRREYRKGVNYVLWILAEIAIAATDLAEALGTIIGLNLLFGVPLLWGCVITAFDTFLLLAILRLGIRKMEAMIVSLIGIIGACFFIEIFLKPTDWGGVINGFVPTLPSGALYVAIGIIGATVMPHNLYLHSSLVQSRAVSKTYTGKAEACRYNFIDSLLALNLAFIINAAILIMSANDFHATGTHVTTIQQAHQLLEPILGTHIAPIVFAIALLASGQSSTLTGTLSGQIVMEGYLNIKMRPWLRRIITRVIALFPAIIVIALMGNEGTYQLLILSQVILSLQLPFAIIPLIHFTSSKKKMGMFASKPWLQLFGWSSAGILIVLNIKLLIGIMTDWLTGASIMHFILIMFLLAIPILVLIYIIFKPLFGISSEWAGSAPVLSQMIAQNISPMHIKNIGVALEHTDADAEILSAALSIAKTYKARLTLIHITETPSALMLGGEADSLHSREDQTYLLELVREIESPEFPVESYYSTGNPVNEIIKAIESIGLDMLVVGSHGHKGFEDLSLGETVNQLRHAITIPVLIVRPSAKASEKPQKEFRQ
ncbi:MAG: iron/manganese transporter [Candidatus Fischerbacteria bacterium RBG_13_37_8]|uniref:Divalent metal cation transporter MntH n=1 Tax=Candidatus Fischerbacteria bacterium RBG_13_37_8 TaxID=1817863 RepID=A0A1F5VWI4_9BACT|nr:MAG: iron/manganese transporter [Candidatus Fischerbacteria bacterium RBG_13_37_8]